jgi:ATP-dependent Clp protease protease subunit
MDLLDILIPEETGANKQLPDPFLLNYYEALSNRYIWVEDEITGSVNEIVKKILWWNADDEDKSIPVEQRTPIKIFISSPGGDLYAMLGLVDVIQASSTPVYTINVSMAASAACLLLISGHKRFAFPHSTSLWHAGSAGLEGTMEQVQSASKHFDGLENKLKDFFLSKTKVDVKKYRRQKDKDWYFDANEQFENGLVDKIITNISEIL